MSLPCSAQPLYCAGNDKPFLGVFPHQNYRMAELRGGRAETIIEQMTELDMTNQGPKLKAMLKASEERYHQLFESVNDAIFLRPLSPEGTGGNFIEVNRVACERLGYSREELLQKSPADIDPCTDLEQVRRQAEQLLKGQGVIFEAVHQAKDGRRIPVEISSRIVVWDGQPLMLSVARDLTERKRLEEQLRQAQKMEAIGQLAGGVAHDFNNILSSVLMNLGLLKDQGHLPAEALECLKDLENESLRATRLIRQLLLFSRKQVAEMKVLDLNEVLVNLAKMLGRLLGENIDLRLLLSETHPWIQADAGMMEQVIMNLCLNARDAMPQGGRLMIVTSIQSPGQEPTESDHVLLAPLPKALFRENDPAFSTRTTAFSGDLAPEASAPPWGKDPWKSSVQPSSYVCLAVMDTGCGMDHKTLQHIFEPFFTTKEAGKGTGLGLATVYGIVKQHGGWIEVASQTGQGSLFRVCLPLLMEPVETATPTDDTNDSRGGSETILMVEDELSVRRVTALFLRKLGYRILEAANGTEALQLWEQHRDRIDLLFTDLVLPGPLSGLELAAQLRQGNPNLKAIISSGYRAEGMKDLSIPGPTIWHLAKPFQAVALAKTVRQCLDETSHALLSTP